MLQGTSGVSRWYHDISHLEPSITFFKQFMELIWYSELSLIQNDVRSVTAKPKC